MEDRRRRLRTVSEEEPLSKRYAFLTDKSFSAGVTLEAYAELCSLDIQLDDAEEGFYKPTI